MRKLDRSKEVSDQDVQQLLKLAGPRPEPPADVEARVRAATLAAVAALPDADSPIGRISSWRGLLAVAAGLVVAVAASFLLAPGPTVEQAGEVVFAAGDYTVRGSENAHDGQVLPGSILQTAANARVMVALESGPALRLAGGTRLTLQSAREVWLHHGRVYIDSDAAGANRNSIVVVAPFASVTDVGTRFEVVVDGDKLEVATRDGQVDIESDVGTIRSSAGEGVGEVLVIDALNLRSRTSLLASDDRWGWTHQARPPFQLADRSILEYLQWVSRESGRPLRYASATVRQQASLRRFGGQFAQADLADLDRTLSTTRFRVSSGDKGSMLVDIERR